MIIRFLKTLKDKVKNKARVEASIAAAYLLEESSTFASFYFPPNRNKEDDNAVDDQISIFNYPGETSGAHVTKWLDDRDYNAAKLYILRNCDEVDPYIE